MIKYDKVIKLLDDAGYNSYRIKKESKDFIGTATYYAIKNPDSGKGLDYRSIDKLCKRFNCQPGDLMEWVPDEPETKTEVES